MKDILNRELHDYDLVIGMIISRYSDGMRFGVWKDNNVVWENGIRSNVRNVYLVGNPNEQETAIKNKIIEKIEEHEKAKGVKVEYIKSKELKIGNIYETVSGQRFAYLGKGTINILSNKEENSSSGYLYLYRPSYLQNGLKSESFDKNIYLINLFSCLKSKKKFVKDAEESIEIMDNPCIITETYEQVWGYKKFTKVSITLEEV